MLKFAVRISGKALLYAISKLRLSQVYRQSIMLGGFGERSTSGRPRRDKLRFVPILRDKISHTLRCPSFSAKSHVCECLVFINAHIYAFAALPTFRGYFGGGAEHKTGDHTGSPLRYIIESGKRLKIIKSRGVYVAFYTSMRVEMQRIS